jgi:hypothetical protein
MKQATKASLTMRVRLLPRRRAALLGQPRQVFLSGLESADFRAGGTLGVYCEKRGYTTSQQHPQQRSWPP